MRLIALLIAGCMSMILPAQAEDGVSADKSSIQSAFLYNFALFTDWPRLPDKEFSICVMASDRMVDGLATVRHKQVKGLPILIKRIDSPKQAKSCQILFVGKSEHPAMKEIAQQIGSDPVLVVSEENGFDIRNVIIALGEHENRISFKINRTRASQNALTFSSQLLKLAKQVY